MALRWEWRTFGDHFGAAERRLGAVHIDSVVDSDETYLLADAGRDAVKVRAGMMDLKHLMEVDPDGLELWRPVMKAPLPLLADDARTVLEALCVRAELPVGSYDLDDLARLSHAVRVVPVHKTRRHFTFAGCMAELTDIRTPDRATRTVAIEAEQPSRVVEAVRELGLDGHANTNVPSGLKALS